MGEIRTSWKVWPLAFVHSTEANDSIGATGTILERARAELEGAGANSINQNGPTSFRFRRRWFSWGRTWMQNLSGEVRVEPAGHRLVVSIQTNIGTLLGSGAVFAFIAALIGLPLGFGLALVGFVVAFNGGVAFLSIRRMISRAIQTFL